MHPYNKENIYKGVKDIPLQGKSLAAVVLGEKLWRSSVTPNRAAKTMVSTPATPANASANGAISMPTLQHNFAISQVVRCAQKSKLRQADQLAKQSWGANVGGKNRPKRPTFLIWTDCDINKHDPVNEVSLMG